MPSSPTANRLRPSGVEGTELVFRYPDPDDELASLRLWQDLGIPGDRLDFARVPGGWELRLPRPSVQRVEYIFEGRSREGGTIWRLDPANPNVVGGAFGDKSWLALPGYQAPAWTESDSPPWTTTDDTVRDTPVGEIEMMLWEPDGHDPGEPMPLLVAHDGPEYAMFAGLTHFVAATIAAGTVPALRVALLAPGERNARYAANPRYADALVDHVLPRIAAVRPVLGRPALIGASLGALAALHAEWTHPGTFAGLMLQSGSFFTPQTDPQESEFAHFAEITGFVATVLAAEAFPSTSSPGSAPPQRPGPGAGGDQPLVTMTCGATEENVHCNRVMARRLEALGLDLDYGEHADVHNYTSWRDVLEPRLSTLMARLWGDRRGTHGGETPGGGTLPP